MINKSLVKLLLMSHFIQIRTSLNEQFRPVTLKVPTKNKILKKKIFLMYLFTPPQEISILVVMGEFSELKNKIILSIIHFNYLTRTQKFGIFQRRQVRMDLYILDPSFVPPSWRNDSGIYIAPEDTINLRLASFRGLCLRQSGNLLHHQPYCKDS